MLKLTSSSIVDCPFKKLNIEVFRAHVEVYLLATFLFCTEINHKAHTKRNIVNFMKIKKIKVAQ